MGNSWGRWYHWNLHPDCLIIVLKIARYIYINKSHPIRYHQLHCKRRTKTMFWLSLFSKWKRWYMKIDLCLKMFILLNKHYTWNLRSFRIIVYSSRWINVLHDDRSLYSCVIPPAYRRPISMLSSIVTKSLGNNFEGIGTIPHRLFVWQSSLYSDHIKHNATSISELYLHIWFISWTVKWIQSLHLYITHPCH